ERDGDRAAPAQHGGAADLHRPGDHHAHVPGGEARGHVRAPPHVPRPRERDRARQVHRRAGPRGGHGRAVGALRRAGDDLRQSGDPAHAVGLLRARADGGRLPRDRHADLVIHRQRRDRVRRGALRAAAPLHDRLDRRDDPGRRRRHRPLHLDHRPLPGAHEGRHRHARSRLLRDRARDRPLPDATVGRIGALEVGRVVRRSASVLGLLGLVFLGFGVGAFALLRTLADWYVLLNLIAGVGLLLAYAAYGLENLRTAVGSRSTRYGASAAFYTVLFLALVVGLNFVLYRHHHRWATTEAGVYTLSPQSKQYVGALKDTLDMVAFVEGGQSPQLQSLLDSYQNAAPDHVKFRVVDPDKEPALVDQMKITTAPSLHLQYGKESFVVTQ